VVVVAVGVRKGRCRRPCSVGLLITKLWRPNLCVHRKRSMTTDFAMVVYRIKLLGFNAIRVQFK
jgi:hypothetical protein